MEKEDTYLYNAIHLLGKANGSGPATVGKRASRLGDWLGEEHDLVLLSNTVQRNTRRMSRSTTRGLRLAIRDRRNKLKAKALRLGAKTYAHRPKRANE